MQKQQNQAPLAEPNCCVKFMKLFLIILNIFILLLGIATLAVGVWSLTDDYGADNIEVIMETDLYTAGAVILVVGGAVIILMAFLGAFGAAFGNRIMLGIYFGIMVFFGVLFIAGFIVAFFFMDELESSLADKLTDKMKNNYGVDVDTNSANSEITTVWKDIQRSLKCCGVRGDLTSTESWFQWQSTKWFTTEGQAPPNPANHVYVPSTCCNTAYSFDKCQMKDDSNNQPPKTDVALVTEANPALYHRGCLDVLDEKIDEHIIAIVSLAIILFIVIVVCAVFAMVLIMESARVGHVV